MKESRLKKRSMYSKLLICDMWQKMHVGICLMNLILVNCFCSLRNPACDRQNSSYRATTAVRPGSWATVRLPWDAFVGYGPGPDVTPFVPLLRRLGIVSIGKEKDVVLAVGRVGFYNVV